jgi:hypothetical protein
LKGSFCQSREIGEIMALSEERNREVGGDSVRNSHCLLLVPDETNPITIIINNKIS